MATEIRIDDTGEGTWWLYNSNGGWKDYVSENFDEHMVLKGNRDYTECAEATWWNKAKEVISDLELYENEAMRYYRNDYTREQRKAIVKAFEDCRCTDDTNFILEILGIIYPEMEFETATIRGYCQGDWQEVIYVKGKVDIDCLEALYFGKVADVTVNTDEDEYGDIITHDELWKMERGNLKEELRKRYEIPEDEELIVFKCDGFKRVADWKEVA